MDPTANLIEQIKLAKSILRDVDNADADTGEWTTDLDDVYRLAELVESLHDWIRRGGQLPSLWDATSI